MVAVKPGNAKKGAEMNIDEAIKDFKDDAENNRADLDLEFAKKNEQVAKLLTKLKEYENLEEQGMLIKLPCKVGDTVYVNGVLGCDEAERYRVIRVDYHSTLGTGRNEFYIEALLCADPDSSIAFYDNEFGKTVFLTKSEAEAKLKELRGNINGK